MMFVFHGMVHVCVVVVVCNTILGSKTPRARDARQPASQPTDSPPRSVHLSITTRLPFLFSRITKTGWGSLRGQRRRKKQRVQLCTFVAAVRRRHIRVIKSVRPSVRPSVHPSVRCPAPPSISLHPRLAVLPFLWTRALNRRMVLVKGGGGDFKKRNMPKREVSQARPDALSCCSCFEVFVSTR
jgi:hypothetical protein